MPVLWAGTAAAAFGVADFLGGTAARRVPAALVAALAQFAGLVLALLMLLAWTAPPIGSALVWGLLAGTAGGVGVPLLYRGLARGPMNVVAPLTALTSAVVPVLGGALLGERPSAVAWTGIVLAVLAGVIVGGAAPADDSGSTGVSRAGASELGVTEAGVSPAGRRGWVGGAALALFAGSCFGGFFVLISQADPAAGLWPVAAAKLSGCVVAGLGLLLAGRVRRAMVDTDTDTDTDTARDSGRPPDPDAPPRPGSDPMSGPAPAPAAPEAGPARAEARTGRRLAVAGGVLDAAANASYLLAAQRGQLAVVGAVASLYPVATVVLARVLHAEPIGPRQRIGLALTVPALALVSAG